MAEIMRILSDSVEYGWRIPTVKYLMLAAPFTGGVAIYVFYALQPHLLDLYGDRPRTASPVWSPRSWPARRSWAAS